VFFRNGVVEKESADYADFTDSRIGAEAETKGSWFLLLPLF
jgi:hypothetical protein